MNDLDSSNFGCSLDLMIRAVYDLKGNESVN